MSSFLSPSGVVAIPTGAVLWYVWACRDNLFKLSLAADALAKDITVPGGTWNTTMNNVGEGAKNVGEGVKSVANSASELSMTSSGSLSTLEKLTKVLLASIVAPSSAVALAYLFKIVKLALHH